MSVSSRNTKAVIYAELERFREIADYQRNGIAARDAQIACLNERIANLEMQVGESKRQRPQQTQPRPTNFEARRQAAIALCKELGVRSVTRAQVDEYLAA